MIFTTIYIYIYRVDSFFFFFKREFQSIMSAFDDNYLSSDQDTNHFLVKAGIEPQIFYTTIRYFTS